MIENNWKDIWRSKHIDLSTQNDKNEYELFCELKKADGFDVNVENENEYYRSFYSRWIEIYNTINKITNYNYDSIYEVGCGSGVNLFLFMNRLKDSASYGGIDYSSSLIDIAKEVITSEDLICDEAINIDSNRKYDIIISDSVFQYFSDLNYAQEVLEKMICKSNKIVYLGELHDLEKKEQWLDMRRKSIKNYDEVYHGLSKLFFSKFWVKEIAKRHNRECLFSYSENAEYLNNEYIFDCYIF